MRNWRACWPIRAGDLAEIISEAPDIEVPGLPEGADLTDEEVRKKVLQAIGRRMIQCFGNDSTRVIDGFEIAQIKKASVAEQLGLQDGDVVLAVNGQPLDGLPTVMKVFGEFQAAPKATVTVLRKGQKMTIEFSTK